MAKSKIQFETVSYGMYSEWDRKSKELPTIKKFTLEIPAKVGVEFGYILNIKRAKGKQISFCIDHPPFNDSKGKPAAPFTGDVYVRTNDWNFFIGDTIWEPIYDKVGPWRITVELDGQLLEDKTFQIVGD